MVNVPGILDHTNFNYSCQINALLNFSICTKYSHSVDDKRKSRKLNVKYRVDQKELEHFKKFITLAYDDIEMGSTY